MYVHVLVLVPTYPLFDKYMCVGYWQNYLVTVQLKRQVNGFWIVELIIVNDFRQVCVCLCACFV